RSVEQPVDRKRFLGSGRRNRTAVRIDGSRLSARGWGRLIDGSAGRQIERSLATAPEKSERQDAGQERQNANERAHEDPHTSQHIAESSFSRRALWRCGGAHAGSFSILLSLFRASRGTWPGAVPP